MLVRMVELTAELQAWWGSRPSVVTCAQCACIDVRSCRALLGSVEPFPHLSARCDYSRVATGCGMRQDFGAMRPNQDRLHSLFAGAGAGAQGIEDPGGGSLAIRVLTG
jgi:hypothetical protein